MPKRWQRTLATSRDRLMWRSWSWQGLSVHRHGEPLFQKTQAEGSPTGGADGHHPEGRGMQYTNYEEVRRGPVFGEIKNNELAGPGE